MNHILLSPIYIRSDEGILRRNVPSDQNLIHQFTFMNSHGCGSQILLLSVVIRFQKWAETQ